MSKKKVRRKTHAFIIPKEDENVNSFYHPGYKDYVVDYVGGSKESVYIYGVTKDELYPGKVVILRPSQRKVPELMEDKYWEVVK